MWARGGLVVVTLHALGQPLTAARYRSKDALTDPRASPMMLRPQL